MAHTMDTQGLLMETTTEPNFQGGCLSPWASCTQTTQHLEPLLRFATILSARNRPTASTHFDDASGSEEAYVKKDVLFHSPRTIWNSLSTFRLFLHQIWRWRKWERGVGRHGLPLHLRLVLTTAGVYFPGRSLTARRNWTVWLVSYSYKGEWCASASRGEQRAEGQMRLSLSVWCGGRRGGHRVNSTAWSENTAWDKQVRIWCKTVTDVTEQSEFAFLESVIIIYF